MDPAVWAILLLLAGLLLIAIEVFIPSGGLIAVASSACIVFSVMCAWQAWWPAKVGCFYGYLAVLALIIPSVLILAFKIWPHTPMGRRAILAGPRLEDVTPFVEEEQHLRKLIGRVGQTASVLNPAGIINLDGERLHCQSEGMIIEVRMPVQVIAVQAQRLVVRPHDSPSTSPGLTSSAPGNSAREDVLDFDLN